MTRTIRVVLVEDNQVFREALDMLLSLQDDIDVVASVDNGSDAASVCALHQPDVAVIDIGLPGCDGYEVARQMRDMSDGRAIFLIALTGLSHPDDRRRAVEAGFDVYLVKPIDPDRLSGLLTSHDGSGPHSLARG